MRLSTTILRNIASNWAGYAVNAAVTLFLTPYVLHQLGDARYGIWLLTSSIIGYYGLLDLGFRAGVTQFLTKFLAVGDHDKANECMSSAVIVLAGAGVSVAALSFGIAYAASNFYDFSAGMEHEVYWCIVIVGVSSGLGFVFFPFMAVFTAKQRYDLANLIGVTTRLLTAGSIYAALRYDCGLIGISAATGGASMVDYLIRWRVAYRILPQLNISSQRFRVDQLRGMASFGGWNFLISVSTYAYKYAHMLIISFFLPLEALAYYGLAVGLSSQISRLLSGANIVFYPVATSLHFGGDQKGLERLCQDGTRLMCLIIIPSVLVASFWATDFYRLWVGEKYVTGSPFPSVALLLRIMLAGTAAMYVTCIPGQILLGSGRVRLLAQCVTLEMVLNLALSLISVQTFGLIGVAVSGMVASLVVRLFVIPLAVQRTLGLQVSKILFGSCLRPMAVGTLFAIQIMCIRLTGTPQDWFHLCLQGAVAGAAYVVTAFVVGLTDDERHRFLVQPVKRFMSKA